ncbi:prepilin-type N-terminal cleavage/methylation domain-containing protein [Anabaena sp. UHCC 0451]|uniref:prepilin-type N-terminal cleavage/methylation domain-containing protein n=1 Tax=Anabaena sp. UHCC 0451 TaxID=2055235 RepID=UPI002B216783|nr:prepilin-type N-terminal cleavage/methylation domain-containing protein [Anabaena sp. UHCC 0451]MEA5575421.1 prepilin-type N-terminal cleavage/methylation domain-containing protein [Anabaena sp. UHCC 0451]
MKSDIKNIQSEVDVNKGFTLIEVLVAAVIMSIVVALAGTAFVGIIQQNQKAKFESDRRTNLNRALDYIANEIRMARTVTIAAPSPTASPATTITSGTGVLRLRVPVPNPENGSAYNPRQYTVVYYTAGSATGWESPNSIWRYANVPNPVPIRTATPLLTPSSGVTAALTVPAPSPTSAATLDHNFLVDGIRDPATLPTCPSGSTRAGGNGFYACVYTGGRQVDLFLYGKLSNDTNIDETMEVKTTVFTRTSIN